VFTDRGLRVDSCSDLDDYAVDEIEAARIPLERATGAILLLAGGDNHRWRSAAMTERLVDTMRKHGREDDISSVTYPSAGHAFLMAPMVTRFPSGAPPFDSGGNSEVDVAAADAWDRIARFLSTT